MTWKTRRVRGQAAIGVYAANRKPFAAAYSQLSLRTCLPATGRLVVTTRRVKTLLRKSNNCKLTLCLFFTVVILLAILVLVIKLAPLAALG
jgi:hypothetical protein